MKSEVKASGYRKYFLGRANPFQTSDFPLQTSGGFVPAQVDLEAQAALRHFADMTAEEIEQTAALAEEVRLKPGDVLFQQGDAGDSAYVILSGQMEMRIGITGGEERNLAVLEPGGLFGEMSLLLGEPRSATAVARTEARLWKLPKTAVEEALRLCEPWSARFLMATVKMLAMRLLKTDRHIVNLLQETEEQAKPPTVKIAELDQLRQRLFTQWSF
jgi:CRP-like cAMP-binding protein